MRSFRFIAEWDKESRAWIATGEGDDCGFVTEGKDEGELLTAVRKVIETHFRSDGKEVPNFDFVIDYRCR